MNLALNYSLVFFVGWMAGGFVMWAMENYERIRESPEPQVLDRSEEK